MYKILSDLSIILRVYNQNDIFMKQKIVFLLIFALSVILTSCSCFDSKPINPKILGVGNVECDSVQEICFVRVGAYQYVATEVILSCSQGKSCITRNPKEGMLVTVFTSPTFMGARMVAGEQSVEQIEDMYHTNHGMDVFFCCYFFLIVITFLGCFIAIGFASNQKEEEADKTDR